MSGERLRDLHVREYSLEIICRLWTTWSASWGEGHGREVASVAAVGVVDGGGGVDGDVVDREEGGVDGGHWQ